MTLAVQLYIILHLLLGAPLDTLVSKDQGLPAWYSPGLDPQAVKALEEMITAAEAEGLQVWITSDYRDYHDQLLVAHREGNRYPERYRSFSAEPGHSEHQLGTTFDLAWAGVPSYSNDPRNFDLFAWLEANAHRYGFVISYPYKEIPTWPFHNRWLPQVTEYVYEPWHLRYVGPELASQMWEDGYLDPLSPLLPQEYYRPWY